ncbi:MAG: hemerythrin domain-containing protein [Terriglobales bacterium]
MLTQIQTGASPGYDSLAAALRGGDASDAVDLLQSCHQRIRHFTALAARLCRPDAPPELVAQAARAVHRYYCQALPLHEADENDSVYPRLRALRGTRAAGALRPAPGAAPPPAELAEANQAMVDQHLEIDRLIAELLPLWLAIAERPEQAPASAALVERLQAAWDEHLTLEERVIFPAMRQCLHPEARAAIRREMALRRQR